MKKQIIMLFVMALLATSITFCLDEKKEISKDEEILISENEDLINEELLELFLNEAKLNVSKTNMNDIIKSKNNADIVDFDEHEEVTAFFEQKERDKEFKKEELIKEITEKTPLEDYEAEVVMECSELYDIRPSLILAIIDLESSFNKNLVGTSNDRGYMQIIPNTEKWLANAYGSELGLKYNPKNIFNAEYNIKLAVKYLSVLKNKYKDDTQMLTAYNRGEGGMASWYKKYNTYETEYSKVVFAREEKYLDITW